jgi:post-segregation antitoxin (ccd killing protein)
MPKMQVYLPDELYEKTKALSSRINVSGVLQEALTLHLERLERRDALHELLRDYEATNGKFTEEELQQQAIYDAAHGMHPHKEKISAV